MDSEFTEYSCSECKSQVGKDDKTCSQCGANLSEVIREVEEIEEPINSCYVSLQSRFNFLNGLLLLSILVSVLSVVYYDSFLSTVDSVMRGNTLSYQEADNLDSTSQTISIFQLLIFASTAIVFLNWKNRAYKNLRSLKSHRLEFTSAWAVGCYFVPFINLFKPLNIMKEIWKASDPEFVSKDNIENKDWKKAESSSLLTLWWTFFLFNNAFSYISLQSFRRLNTLQQYYDFGIYSIISDVFSIISCVCLIVLANKITKRQNEKFGRLLVQSTSNNEVVI